MWGCGRDQSDEKGTKGRLRENLSMRSAKTHPQATGLQLSLRLSTPKHLGERLLTHTTNYNMSLTVGDNKRILIDHTLSYRK